MKVWKDFLEKLGLEDQYTPKLRRNSKVNIPCASCGNIVKKSLDSLKRRPETKCGSCTVVRKAEKHLKEMGLEELYYPKLTVSDKIEIPCQACGKIKNTTIAVAYRQFKTSERVWCSSCVNKEKAASDTEARQKAMLKKYGVAFPLQIPGIKEKRAKTNQARYGGNAPSCSPEIKAKIKKTCQERYNADSPSENREIVLKQIKTNQERYGGNSATSCPKVRATIKANNLAKYGKEYTAQVLEVKEKIKKTNIEKYGNPYANRGKMLAKTPFSTKKELVESAIAYLDENPKISISALTVLPEYGISAITLTRAIKSAGRSDLLYRYSPSKGELSLRNWVESLGIKVEANRRDLITPLEIDIYCPEYKIGIEYHGLYWHSVAQKPKKYHLEKRKLAEKAGIRLFQIHEDEWFEKESIVKSILSHAFGKTETKIYARNTEIKPVKKAQALQFMADNHLMGASGGGFKAVGLFKGTTLVSLLTYKKDGLGGKIDRFCSLLGSQVVGGFSKLIKYIEKTENYHHITSFVDLRYGNGLSYEKQGFTKVSETLGWKWTDGISTHNRRVVRANMDERQLTEAEYAEEAGFWKIYDSGQRKYVKVSVTLSR